jgi:hypothetical protein
VGGEARGFLSVSGKLESKNSEKQNVFGIEDRVVKNSKIATLIERRSCF